MNYHWIGHCKEGTSDKVWGLIRISEPLTLYCDYVSFWGRRGKKLQTKIYKSIDRWDADKLCDKKESGGYKVIDLTRLDEVYPEFGDDLEKTAVWALLSV